MRLGEMSGQVKLEYELCLDNILLITQRFFKSYIHNNDKALSCFSEWEPAYIPQEAFLLYFVFYRALIKAHGKHLDGICDTFYGSIISE